ncbi:MAG: disulfide bond formation protein B [Aquimonas sp.]|nr:disulfide bond formation protein B [Aquimonas sp.]
MNPFSWSFRAQYLTGFLLCAGLLGYALYVEHGMLMLPCPLCILQRIAFVVMAVFFLSGAVFGPRPVWLRRLNAGLVGLAAAVGAGIAGWHVRMQTLPAGDVPSCGGMELSYMVGNFPLRRVAEMVFTGSGDCAKIDWTFLGISMPAWTLAWFIGLGAGALWAGLRGGAR